MLRLLARLVLMCAVSAAGVAAAQTIAEARGEWADTCRDVEPREVAVEWLAPFALADRTRAAALRVVSPFAAGRRSYRAGHLHTGADLRPVGRVDDPITVLPVAPGVVVSVHLGPPHTTVVVRHRLANRGALYTAYKHLTDVTVALGDEVSATTPLGRLFTRREAAALGGPYDHLHLEVRTRFDDLGVASWLTMTPAELAARFIDPVIVLREQLGELTPALRTSFVSAARELLGQPYDFGGRLRRPGDGIDCQGVVFYAAERLGRCGWRSFSTMPTESVRARELGTPVAGLDPIRTADLDPRWLVPGDLLNLLAPLENPAEPSLATLDGEPVWVWHVGIYVGDGLLLNADPLAGEVTEVPLGDYLVAGGYAGVFVTRLRGPPAPARCRTHPAMSIPR